MTAIERPHSNRESEAVRRLSVGLLEIFDRTDTESHSAEVDFILRSGEAPRDR
jgi:hypothetical protein